MPWGSLRAMHSRNSHLIQSAQFSLYVLTKSNHCCCHGQFSSMKEQPFAPIHSFSLFDQTESNHCCHGQVCMNARNGRLLQSTVFHCLTWLNQTIVAMGKFAWMQGTAVQFVCTVDCLGWNKRLLLLWGSLHAESSCLFQSVQLQVSTVVTAAWLKRTVTVARRRCARREQLYVPVSLMFTVCWRKQTIVTMKSLHLDSSYLLQAVQLLRSFQSRSWLFQQAIVARQGDVGMHLSAPVSTIFTFHPKGGRVSIGCPQGEWRMSWCSPSRIFSFFPCLTPSFCVCVCVCVISGERLGQPAHSAAYT